MDCRRQFINSLGFLVNEAAEPVNWITEVVDCLSYLVNRAPGLFASPMRFRCYGSSSKTRIAWRP